MDEPREGQYAPDFKLEATDGKKRTLKDFAGKKLILYFYSKNNTGGCNAEAESFRDRIKDFNSLGAEVVGISKDTAASHLKFTGRLSLNFTLLSDPDRKACESYRVLKEKNMYGKKVIGIDRSTFIIDEDGKIIKIYRGVKVEGHADNVLEFLKTL